MTTIVTRAGKGSPLTNTEIDTNFTNLNTDKLEISVGTITTSTTITPSSSNTQYNVTALATAATIAAPSGTPVHGHKLILRIKDDGSARGLSWNAIWRGITGALPTTTTASKTMYIGAVYNGDDSYWDVMSVTEEA